MTLNHSQQDSPPPSVNGNGMLQPPPVVDNILRRRGRDDGGHNPQPQQNVRFIRPNPYLPSNRPKKSIDPCAASAIRENMCWKSQHSASAIKACKNRGTTSSSSPKKKRNLESILESSSSSPSSVLDHTKATRTTSPTCTTSSICVFKKVKFQESGKTSITTSTAVEAEVPGPTTTAKKTNMLLRDPNDDDPWTVVIRYPLDDHHHEDQQQQEYIDCSLAAFPAPAAGMENFYHKTNDDSWTTAACDPSPPPLAVPLRLSLLGSPTSPTNTGQNRPSETASPFTTTIATTRRSVGEDELLGYRPRLVSDAHEEPLNRGENGTVLSSTPHSCSPRTVLSPSIVPSPHEDDEEEDEGTTNYHQQSSTTSECSPLLVPLWHMTLCLVTVYTALVILRRITSDPKQTIDYFVVDTHCPLVHRISFAAGTVLKHYRYCSDSLLSYWFHNDSTTITATTFCHAEDSFLKLLLGDVWVRTASQDSLSLVLKGLQDSWIVFPLYLFLVPTLLTPLDVMIVVLLEFLEHRLGLVSGGTTMTQSLYRFLQGLVHVLEYPFGILCTICQWSWWGLGTMPYSYYYSVRRALSASSTFQHYHHSTATPTPASVGGYWKRVWLAMYEVISTLAFTSLVCRVTRLAVVGGYHHHNTNSEFIQHLMDSIWTHWNEYEDWWKSVLKSAVHAVETVVGYLDIVLVPVFPERDPRMAVLGVVGTIVLVWLPGIMLGMVILMIRAWRGRFTSSIAAVE